MKHLEVFETYKSKSVRKNSDNRLDFFDINLSNKVDEFENFDVYANIVGDYYFCKNEEPIIYLHYKMENLPIEEETITCPSIQFYTVHSKFRKQKLSLVPYEWLLKKYKRVISDFIQSEGDMYVWTELFKLYHVKAYDAQRYKLVDDLYVENRRVHSKSINIYNSANRLIISDPARIQTEVSTL